MTDHQLPSRTGTRTCALWRFIVLLAAVGVAIAPASAAAQGATWFEGALLIDGSGDPPVAD